MTNLLIFFYFFQILLDFDFDLILSSLGFQSPATPVMVAIINFHNMLMTPLVSVCIFVFWLLFVCITYFQKEEKVDNFTHATDLEITWTIIPALILSAIAIPSFSLLYCMDEILDPSLTFKIIGHQWYWSYEFSDYGLWDDNLSSFSFDSYMVQSQDIQENQLRLLEVDNRLVLPVETHLRAIISSADVLHSWAVPSFGVKVDACPGRLNEICIYINQEGTFYGQCSELCGTNHGFMPIAVETTDKIQFVNWILR